MFGRYYPGQSFFGEGEEPVTIGATFTVDAVVFAINTKSFTADVIVASRNTKEFTVDAIIFDENGAWQLGGFNTPRPSFFNRTFVRTEQKMIAINGRESRDMSNVKEVFRLGWNFLSEQETLDIISIVERDVAQVFDINVTGIKMDAVSVFPTIRRLEYAIPGSSYFARLELELRQVA